MRVAAVGTVRPAVREQTIRLGEWEVERVEKGGDVLAPAKPTTLMRIPAMYATYALILFIRRVDGRV